MRLVPKSVWHNLRAKRCVLFGAINFFEGLMELSKRLKQSEGVIKKEIRKKQLALRLKCNHFTIRVKRRNLEMKLKRTVAVFGAAALVLSMLPSAFAAEESVLSVPGEGITVEVEDLFGLASDDYNKKIENENAGGGALWHIGWGKKEGSYEETAKINVTAGGTYTIHMRSSKVQSNLSKTELFVDDVSVIDNTASPGGEMIGLDNNFDGTNAGKVYEFYNPNVTLTAGEHTVKLVFSRSGNPLRNACTLDNIKILPNTAPVNTSGETVFEIEDFYPETVQAGLSPSSEASGGQWLVTGWDSRLGTHEKTVNISESGLYKMTFRSSCNNGAKIFDTPEFFVDDKLMTSAYSSSSYLPKRIITGDAEYNSLNEYNCAAFLSAGEHKIKLISKLESNTSRHAVSYDNIKFERINAGVVNSDKARFEAEDLFSFRTGDTVSLTEQNEKASGGAYVSRTYSNPDYANEFKNTIVITESGNYKVKLAANGYSKFVSNNTLKLDGETLINAKSTQGTSLGYNGADSSAFPMTEFSGREIYLKAGEHSLEYIPELDENNKQHKFIVDYIELEKSVPAAISLPESGIKTVEYEEIAKWGSAYLTDSEAASGGKYVVMAEYMSDLISDFALLNAPKDGFYDVHFLANSNEQSFSGIIMSIDDQTVVNNDSVNPTQNTKTTLTSFGNCVLRDYSARVYLTAGDHNLSIMYKKGYNQGGGYYRHAIAADCLTFEYAGSPIDYEFTSTLDTMLPFVINDGINAGDEIKVYAGSNEIQNGDVYQITYSSSNEGVMTVDGNGVLTPVCRGYSDISVVVCAADKIAAKFSKRLYVTDDETGTIHIENVRYENGKVTFDTVDDDFSETAAKAVAAGYSGGKLTDIKVIDITDRSESSYSAPLSGADSVKVFVFDSLSSLKPLWVATEAE